VNPTTARNCVDRCGHSARSAGMIASTRAPLDDR